MLTAAACTGSPAAVEAPARPTADLTLREATAVDVATALANAAHVPVVVDASAESLARRTRITLASGGPQPVDDLVALASGALRSRGLTLRRTPVGIVLERLPEAAVPSNGPSLPPPSLPPSLPIDPPMPPDPAEAAAAEAATATVLAGIRARGADEFDITRAALDAFLENQAVMTRQARIIPHQEDGRVVGLKLYGIRRTSVFGTLGLQNGDTVRSINGMDLSNPEAALEAYSALRGTDALDVSITRRGEDRTLHYRIVRR
jgi:hypothetical protein